MKKVYMSLALITATVLTFGGCGGTSTSSEPIVDQTTSYKPHRITRDYTDAEEPLNYEDFAAKIDIQASYHSQSLFIDIASTEPVITYDMAHMQVYLDIDNNTSTGLTLGDGVYAIKGADFMIEDNHLFKSTNPNDWEWEYVADVTTYEDGLGTEDPALYSKHIAIPSELITHKNIKKVNISIEPIDENWDDTNNYVPATAVKTQIRVGKLPNYYVPRPDLRRYPITCYRNYYINLLDDIAFGLSDGGSGMTICSSSTFKFVITAIDMTTDTPTTIGQAIDIGTGAVYRGEMYVDPKRPYIYIIGNFALFQSSHAYHYLEVVDRSDPANMKQIASLKLTNEPLNSKTLGRINMTRAGDVLRIFTQKAGLLLVDVKDPKNPTLIQP